MLTTEKETELKALLADQPDLLSDLLARVETTDKAAQDAKIAYKDAPDWAQALMARLDALEATVKAAPMEEEVMAEEEAVVDEEVVAEEADAGMDDAAFAQMIAEAVVQALTPLLDIEKKMAGHLADLKTTIGGYSSQKDAAEAELKTEVADLKQQVKEIAVGDIPQSVIDSVLGQARGMYRPSAAADNLIPQAAAETVKAALTNIPAGLNDQEADAYRLIFGS